MKHPFLDPSITPNWEQMTPDHIEPDISHALKLSKYAINAIANQPKESLNYDSTLHALELATEPLSNAWGKVVHLDSVCNSDALRKAHNAMLPQVSNFFSELLLNPELWAVIKGYSQTNAAKGLPALKQRHIDKTVKDFQEAGADLPKEKRDRLIEINAQLSQLTQTFSENVLDATNAWDIILEKEKDLAGLPESTKEAAKQSALSKAKDTEGNPKWRFTLHAPSMIPILHYLKNDHIRKQVWEAANNIGRKAPHDNTQLVQQILQLRQEKANILGKENFADLILQRCMAKNGKTALGFIEDLHDRIFDAFRNEIKVLENFKAKETNTKPERFEPWEITYWAEKCKNALYDFDPELLRPYFPINSVINGLFEITQKIFDIRLEEKKGPPIWHPDVKYYELYDRDSHELLGAFYTDWHPRESKRGGAWMNCLLTGVPQKQPHLAIICGNLTPPLPGKPVLLNHDEVITIFHEFGHLLHHLLGQVEIKSLNGIHVVWDFVELPSQLFENWCWERESLDLFARHYETDEPIPEDLFRKMIATRNYLSGMAFMRQLSLGKMDLELHIHYDRYKDQDLEEAVNNALESYNMPFKTTAPPVLKRLGHIFSHPTGYAAGYYSYKWAEVLDADVFTQFKKKGVMNPETGREYRAKILSKGNSEPAEVLYRNFMSRDPDPNALLERSGLINSSVVAW